MPNIQTVSGYPALVSRQFRQSFLRMKNEVLGFKTQATWFIDPVNGNDENLGDTSGAAIKTWSQVRERLPKGNVSQNTTFTILNDIPSSDPFDVSDWCPDSRYVLTFTGTPSIISSGTLTAFTARVASTNTPNQVTDTGRASWAAYVAGGYMIKMTSGNANGYCAYIAKNLGSNAARVSSFYDGVSFTEAVPTTNDTYSIIKLTTVPVWNIGSNGAGRRYVFKNLDFYNSSQTPNYFSANGINFYNCRLYATPQIAGFIRYFNCCAEYFQGYGGFALIFAGMCIGIASNAYTEIERGQQFQVSDGTLFQSVNVEIIDGGFIRAYDMGVFDSYADGIRMHAFGDLRAEKLWGSGNAGYGVNTYGSGRVVLNTGVASPSITGTSGDVRLNATTKNWSTLISDGYTKDTVSSASVGPM